MLTTQWSVILRVRRSQPLTQWPLEVFPASPITYREKDIWDPEMVKTAAPNHLNPGMNHCILSKSYSLGHKKMHIIQLSKLKFKTILNQICRQLYWSPQVPIRIVGISSKNSEGGCCGQGRHHRCLQYHHQLHLEQEQQKNWMVRRMQEESMEDAELRQDPRGGGSLWT